MGKILCFVYDTMTDFEMTLACSFLNDFKSKTVVSFGYEKSPVKSTSGLIYNPEMTIMEAISSLNEIDGLIIPGGYDRILSTELKQLIKQFKSEKKLLAAICSAPEFLARSGVLEGKKYTTTLLPEEYSKKGEIDPFNRENFLDQSLVRDDNVITAKGSAFIDFALEILEWFNLFEKYSEKEELRNYLTPF
ncbi:MAG: DJ-1/PfpI family protein [Candidatus Hodarchaeales archaeon]|jgi:putative intracellular protease/amidase